MKGQILLVGSIQKKRGIFVCKAKYYKTHPWAKTWGYIQVRCSQRGHSHYSRGIKNLISLKELKYLWDRDGAAQMECPTISRKDHNKHYELSNCFYEEKSEHLNIKPIKQLTREGKLIKVWPNMAAACNELGLNRGRLCAVVNKVKRHGMKTTGGYRWERV